MRIRSVVSMGAIVLSAVACGGGVSEDLKTEAVEHYADLVHEAYSSSLRSAEVMDEAIDAFLDDPTAANLDAARGAWLAARDDYGPTEAFRFYGGPIDNDETGVEGLVNAWPLDEAYIDYVEGAAGSGIVNMAGEYPEIDALLVSVNEEGGESNISTGWHAIEFLLWGQDLDVDGPGARPVEDYTTTENADRRATYLAETSDLLLTHLQEMVIAWAPGDSGNFRSGFVALPADEAIGMMMTGMGELSRGELAGERMNVAYEARSQEDEHSCFSDNTTNDIIANASGVEMVYLGAVGDIDGPGIYDLVAAEDEELADRLRAEIARSITLAGAIPAPFDQHLAEGVSDDDPGRAAILDTIVALETQADSIVDASVALGVEINLS